MPIEHDTTTLRSLFADHDSGKLALPNFQRDFVWSLDAQKQLLASALSGFPVGSILLLKGTKHDFAARPLGRMTATEPAEDCIYLLDGQQRLTCFYHFFTDPFGEAKSQWQSVIRDTYYLVRNRWSVRVVPDDGEDDPFGYLWLRFPGTPAEPDDVRDFVHASRVNLTNPTRDYVNPAWYLENLETGPGGSHGDMATRLSRLELARECAQDGLVPLWEVNGLANDGADRSSLHKLALQLISTRRREVLEEMIADPPQELLESVYDVQPELIGRETQAPLDDSDDLRQAITAMQQNWVVSVGNYLENLVRTPIPIIELPRDEVDRSVSIFEVMNRGGTPLSAFDLVVARMARIAMEESQPDLGLAQHLVEHARGFEREIDDAMWGDNAAVRPEKWKASNYNFMLDKGSLTPAYKNAFLNLLSIHVHSRATFPAGLETDYIRRKAILDIEASAIADNWEDVADALGAAFCFLNMRCGIRNAGDLRNKLLILPIADAILRAPESSGELMKRLEFWYWSSVMTGTYTERQNDNCIADVESMRTWQSDGGVSPFRNRASRCLDDPFYSDEDTLLRLTEESKVVTDVGRYLALYVLSRNPRDFLSGSRLAAWDVSTDLELHHVVPLRTAASVGQSTTELRKGKNSEVLNSPLNLTFISKAANRSIGARPVDQYMDGLPGMHVASHFLPIEPEAQVREAGESDKAFYRRLLRHRYSFLKQQLQSHLDYLVPMED